MLRFPDRPDALPLNPIWNFETTSSLVIRIAGFCHKGELFLTASRQRKLNAKIALFL